MLSCQYLMSTLGIKNEVRGKMKKPVEVSIQTLIVGTLKSDMDKVVLSGCCLPTETMCWYLISLSGFLHL